MILGRSETVQITIRTTKDEVPPPPVAIQVTGPRVPWTWPDHWDDENSDV